MTDVPSNEAVNTSPRQTSSQPRISLLCLPPNIYQKILQELDERDLKSLSLTCYKFLVTIERTFEYAPALRVSDRTNKVTDTVRIITESEEGQLFEPLNHSTRPVPVLYKTYKLGVFQPRPPTYNESSTQIQPGDFRRQRQLDIKQEKIWLCPHVGCTLYDFNRFQVARYFTTRDTVLAACIFPKCALWARHAVVQTWRGSPGVQELCSVIKAYRIRYRNEKPPYIRQMLTELSQDKLHHALKHLDMPICRHLELGSRAVTDIFDPERISIFAGTHEGPECYPFFSPNVKEGICEYCLMEGTYTTWGFWARLMKSEISADGAHWIDIEMTLSRPVHSYAMTPIEETDWISDCNWRAHCLQENQAINFVNGWWKWAEQVADEGFDWRARLPARFLQTNRSALVNFPQNSPPPYNNYDSDGKTDVNKEEWYRRKISKVMAIMSEAVVHHGG